MEAKDLKVLEELVEKSDKQLSEAIRKRDEEIAALGSATESVKKSVADAEKAMLDATGTLSTRLDEIKKGGDTLSTEVADIVRRMADVEKRFGRPGGPRQSDGVARKSIGQRFVEAMTGDQYRSSFEALKAGHRGGPSVFFTGTDYADQMSALLTMKALGIPYSPETLCNIIAQKATVTTSDATRLIAPVRDSMLPVIKRPLTMRDYMTVRPVNAPSVEYIEVLGMGPETGLAVDSVTSSGTVATVNTTANHGARQGEIIELSGVVEAGYNGVWRIISITDANTFTVQLATDPASDTTTGTILWRNMTHFGAAAPVAEGNAKPEARLKFELKTALIQVIAHWIPATRQVLDDLPELQSMIDNDLSFGVQDAEDIQLLYGTGSSPQLQGILTHGSCQTLAQGSLTPLNAVRRAITYIQLTRMAPNLAVANPLDWDALETEVGTDDHYILAGGASGSEQRVWRLPVFVTTAIAPKTMLIGAFDMGATLYDRQQVSVRFSEHHASYFTSNLLAILAEERVGAAWKRPEAFVNLTLS